MPGTPVEMSSRVRAWVPNPKYGNGLVHASDMPPEVLASYLADAKAQQDAMPKKTLARSMITSRFSPIGTIEKVDGVFYLKIAPQTKELTDYIKECHTDGFFQIGDTCIYGAAFKCTKIEERTYGKPKDDQTTTMKVETLAPWTVYLTAETKTAYCTDGRSFQPLRPFSGSDGMVWECDGLDMAPKRFCKLGDTCEALVRLDGFNDLVWTTATTKQFYFEISEYFLKAYPIDSQNVMAFHPDLKVAMIVNKHGGCRCHTPTEPGPIYLHDGTLFEFSTGIPLVDGTRAFIRDQGIEIVVPDATAPPGTASTSENQASSVPLRATAPEFVSTTMTTPPHPQVVTVKASNTNAAPPDIKRPVFDSNKYGNPCAKGQAASKRSPSSSKVPSVKSPPVKPSSAKVPSVKVPSVKTSVGSHPAGFVPPHMRGLVKTPSIKAPSVEAPVDSVPVGSVPLQMCGPKAPSVDPSIKAPVGSVPDDSVPPHMRGPAKAPSIKVPSVEAPVSLPVGYPPPPMTLPAKAPSVNASIKAPVGSDPVGFVPPHMQGPANAPVVNDSIKAPVDSDTVGFIAPHLRGLSKAPSVGVPSITPHSEKAPLVTNAAADTHPGGRFSVLIDRSKFDLNKYGNPCAKSGAASKRSPSAKVPSVKRPVKTPLVKSPPAKVPSFKSPPAKAPSFKPSPAAVAPSAPPPHLRGLPAVPAKAPYKAPSNNGILANALPTNVVKNHAAAPSLEPEDSASNGPLDPIAEQFVWDDQPALTDDKSADCHDVPRDIRTQLVPPHRTLMEFEGKLFAPPDDYYDESAFANSLEPFIYSWMTRVEDPPAVKPDYTDERFANGAYTVDNLNLHPPVAYFDGPPCQKWDNGTTKERMMHQTAAHEMAEICKRFENEEAARIRRMEDSWAAWNTSPVPSANSNTPKIQCYITPVSPVHYDGVVDIYNLYSRSIFTEHQKPINAADIRALSWAISDRRLPFVVCCKGAPPNNGEQETNPIVVGFAWVSPLFSGNADLNARISDRSRHSANLQVFVDTWYTRRRIGTCLMDAVLRVVAHNHTSTGGYNFFNPYAKTSHAYMEPDAEWAIDPKPKQPLRRIVHQLFLERGVERKSDDAWFKNWIESRFWFWKVGKLEAAGRSPIDNGGPLPRYVDRVIYQMEASPQNLFRGQL